VGHYVLIIEMDAGPAKPVPALGPQGPRVLFSRP
jgi:hypothetical protein